MNLASWIIFFSYKEAQTITTGYEKEINPSSYTEEVDPANFYDQFNDSVLSETITKTVTDAEGSTLSQTTSYLRGKIRRKPLPRMKMMTLAEQSKKTRFRKNIRMADGFRLMRQRFLILTMKTEM